MKLQRIIAVTAVAAFTLSTLTACPWDNEEPGSSSSSPSSSSTRPSHDDNDDSDSDDDTSSRISPLNLTARDIPFRA